MNAPWDFMLWIVIGMFIGVLLSIPKKPANPPDETWELRKKKKDQE